MIVINIIVLFVMKLLNQRMILKNILMSVSVRQLQTAAAPVIKKRAKGKK